MTLAEIRNLFIERSGRYDLVAETEVPVEGGAPGETKIVIVDNGADFFLNAGIRLLDRMTEHFKTVSVKFGSLEAGQYSFTFGNCRTLKEVWLSTAEARWQLRQLRLAEFYDAFSAPASQVTPGSPGVFAVVNLRNQEGETHPYQSLATFIQAFSDSANTINGILIPPVNQPMVVEVVGMFESAALVADDDTNYWSVNYPDLLLLASFYKLETFNRNKEGAADWLAGIQSELQLLEFDFVDQVDQLEDLR